MTRTEPTRPSAGWYILLLLPCIGMLAVPFYNRVEPSLAGIPFFYWYQFSWVPLAAGLTAFVHFVTDRPDIEQASSEKLENVQ